MTQPETEPPGDNSEPSIRYRKSDLEVIADLAPNLKPAELRAFIELARRRDPETHTAKASIRDLAEACNLSKSKVIAALHLLIERNYLTTRKGNATRQTWHQLNPFLTVQMDQTHTPNQFAGGPLKGPPPAKEWSQKGTEPLPFRDLPGPEKGPPPAGNKPLTADARPLDEVPRLIPILDRVLNCKVSHHDPADVDRFRRRLHAHMAKLGRDDRNQPTQNPHPPDNQIVAQLLTVADTGRLDDLLDQLFMDRQPCYSYAWFVTVALERIHGIHWSATRQARAALRDVKRPRPPQPEQGELPMSPPTQSELVNQIQRAAAGKKLR